MTDYSDKDWWRKEETPRIVRIMDIGAAFAFAAFVLLCVVAVLSLA